MSRTADTGSQLRMVQVVVGFSRSDWRAHPSRKGNGSRWPLLGCHQGARIAASEWTTRRGRPCSRAAVSGPAPPSGQPDTAKPSRAEAPTKIGPDDRAPARGVIYIEPG